jgi:hypothetical protein
MGVFMELVKSARRPSRETGTRWRHLPTLIVAALAAMFFIPSAATTAVSDASRDSAPHALAGEARAARLGSGAAAASRLAQAQFSTFGTISTTGAIVDRFGVGNNFDALTFVLQSVGYGTNLFYYLRHA